MLNAVLTVRAHDAASHGKQGWETFTDAAISTLSARRKGLVFLLWGKYAQQKAALIDSKKHHILKAAHPSGFSANKVRPGWHSLSVCAASQLGCYSLILSVPASFPRQQMHSRLVAC